MRLWIACMLLAVPFWEAKTPRDWTDAEVSQLLSDSPWAQPLTVPGNAPIVTAYLATAQPIREAESEQLRRAKLRKKVDDYDAARDEYETYLHENEGKVIILAIRTGLLNGMAEEDQIRQMEKETLIKVGKRRYKLTGHFPPNSTDPYLRLAFPRNITPTDKEIEFEIYVPGLSNPFRMARFQLKELIYHQSLSY